MDYKKLTILILSSIAVAMSTYIATSYGYYVISSNETVEMDTTTITPSCIGLTIASSNAFTLQGDYAVPISDNQFFNSSSTTQAKFKYTFTVKNDCTEVKNLSVGFVSLTGTSDLLNNLRYVLVENNAQLNKLAAKDIASGTSASISGDIQKVLKNEYDVTSSVTYNIGTATVNSNESKTYDLYVWLGDKAGNSSMNQSLNATVILYN